MNRWKSVAKSWVLAWGVTFLIGGLILYTGYQSSLAQSSQERAQKTTREKAQAVSAQVPVPNAEDTGDKGSALTLQAQSGERTVADDPHNALRQEDSGKKSLTIKDFPSPVQGNIIRNVGNYYSEAFENYHFHAGTDYAEPEGTAIRATHGGKVVFAGADPVLGQKVTLDCGEGWLVTYAGLDNLRVQTGEIVEAKESLGQVGFFPGAEGRYGQSQLHYEVWYGDIAQSSESEK